MGDASLPDDYWKLSWRVQRAACKVRLAMIDPFESSVLMFHGWYKHRIIRRRSSKTFTPWKMPVAIMRYTAWPKMAFFSYALTSSNINPGFPSTNDLATSTIQDNQPSEAGNRHWVGKTVWAFRRWRHWSVASPAWVGRPAARRTN